MVYIKGYHIMHVGLIAQHLHGKALVSNYYNKNFIIMYGYDSMQA